MFEDPLKYHLPSELPLVIPVSFSEKAGQGSKIQWDSGYSKWRYKNSVNPTKTKPVYNGIGLNVKNPWSLWKKCHKIAGAKTENLSNT